ncbi:DUF1707 and DUF4190 domain-containing protein [Nocardia sp. BMG51109]|uniref:DUF1707 and DUF4190 domain-containing protein n=1 Tax=Nocardia sp. BMG51109 TaxID=1056816 RepID=UPI0009FBAE42|nr:DUF1707 and DUF4190 domain-containing protein [Nocardia sp. BMG51109]
MEPQWAGRHFLVGDADRERAVEGLKESFQAGRITPEELSDRMGLALSSRTAADLDRAMAGLPWTRPSHPNLPSYYQPPGRRQRGMGIAAFVLGILGFLCGITAVPAIVLGVTALATGTERDDKGFAVAGIAVGVVWVALFGWYLLS